MEKKTCLIFDCTVDLIVLVVWLETKEWNVSTQRVKREDQGCERARLRTLHGVHGNVSVTIWRSDISQYVAVSRPAKIIIFTFMCNTWKRARRAAS